MKFKNVALTKNSKEIQEQLKSLGFDVCICADFEGAKWLNTCDGYHIHGLGYMDKEMFPEWDCPEKMIVNFALFESNWFITDNIDEFVEACNELKQQIKKND